MSPKNPAKKRKTDGIIRWQGFSALGIFGAFVVFYFFFIFDYHLKLKIEAIATALNQAQVEIGSFHTHFLLGQMEINNLRIANQQDPTSNLFKINQIKMKFQVEPLFRKKLIIDDMAINGIHYQVERGVSGAIPEQDFLAHQGLIERVASGFYTELRNEMGENPLRNIGQLLTGIDISSRVENSLGQLASQKKVHEIKQSLEVLGASWDQGVQKLPPLPQITQFHDKIASLSGRTPAGSEGLGELQQIKTSLEGQKIIAGQAILHMTDQAQSLDTEFNSVAPLIDKDVGMLEQRLKLPRLDFSDLTPMLVGPTLLTYLERLTYWIDLSRRRMPKGSRDNSMVLQERARGTTIHFGKMASYPAFMLIHGSIQSQPSPDDPSLGKVNGEIEGLTSDPPISGTPMKFRLTAEFPEREMKGIRVSGIIDHTGRVSKEEITLSADSVPFNNFAINDAGDVTLHLAKARGRLGAKIHFEDNDLSAGLSVRFEDVSYSTSSRFKRIEEVVQSSISGLDTFELKGSVTGQLDHLRFASSSELGQRLATALHSEFHHQIGAIEDDLKKNILDQIYPQKESLRVTFEALKNKHLDAAHNRMNAIQDLIALSDQSIVRGESRKSVARTRHPASSHPKAVRN